MRIRHALLVLMMLLMSAMIIAQGPARDPKTGKFMKKTSTMAPKAGPLRDPKTGKFISKADYVKKYGKLPTSTPSRMPITKMASHKMSKMGSKMKKSSMMKKAASTAKPAMKKKSSMMSKVKTMMKKKK